MTSDNGDQQKKPAAIIAPVRHFGLRRFVAYSLLVHFGALMVWGVPAWIEHSAEADRKAEEKKLAEHFKKQEEITKEHAHQQHIAQTRQDILNEMKKDFDKLTANLSQQKRDELWKQVTDKTTDQANHLADALGKTDTPESDLRTLEAQLQAAQITALDQTLQEETDPNTMAEDYLAKIDDEVAPQLASDLHDQIDKTVAQKMHDDAQKLIGQQGKQDDTLRDQAANQLKDAANQAGNAAKDAQQSATQEGQAQTAAQGSDAKTAANDDRTAGGDLKKAEQALDAAGTALQKAQARTDELGGSAAQATSDAQAQVTAAKTAVANAQQAQQAAAAAPGNSDLAATAQTASANAAQAAAAAASSAKSAADSVGTHDDRSAVAAAAVSAAAKGQLHDAVETAADKDFADTTAPRVAAKLASAFKDEMAADGTPMSDADAAKLQAQITDHLAKNVPGMAKAGDAEADKMADLTPAGANTGGGDVPAGTGKESPLDAALAKGLAAMAAKAAAGVKDVAENASKDGSLVAMAKGDGGIAAGGGDSAAALGDLKDTVAAMAKGLASGRMTGMGSSGDGAMGGLRQAALSRSGSGRMGRGGVPGSIGGVRNEKEYEEISGKIAGRGVVQDAHLDRQGATGETATADDVQLSGDVPARMIGPELGTDPAQLANADPYQPTFKTLAFTAVPFMGPEFQIDGNLKKWDAVPALSLNPEGGPDKSAQTLKIAWSPQGLYFLFVIADPDHKITKANVSNFWMADCAEVWIDAYNTKQKYRARHSGQQFWFWPEGSASDPNMTGGESVVLTKNGGYTPIGCTADKLPRWATETPAGWTMEAMLPAAEITDADLSPGRILGFNTYVSTMAGTNWYWSAGKAVATYAQPDTWGDLMLGGSDAKLEITSGKEGSGTHLAMIGQPLHLRVTDADMNLDPTKPDKVMVTIKDGHGGQQIAVLEETGSSTGVFEGAVSTALALDEPIPAVLGVYEGEHCEIVYVDQARANGARAATETVSVTFASAVLNQDGLVANKQ
jgi:hypothetical protein